MKVSWNRCKNCGNYYSLVDWLGWRVDGYCKQDCKDGKKPTQFIYIKGQKYEERSANGFDFKGGISSKYLGDLMQ